MHYYGSTCRKVVNILKSLLSMSGVAYIVLEQCNKPQAYLEEVQSQGLEAKIILSRRAGRELLSIMKLWLPPHIETT